jgi:MATE family multidrug resistance protein
MALLLGFALVALAACYFHSNHILWLAVSAFMVTKSVRLGVELPRTFKKSSTAVEHKLASYRSDIKIV